MVVEITKTTLKRLVNYEAVVRKEHQEAEQLQWRVMTLEVMQAVEKAGARARHLRAVVAYADYLHRLQHGEDRSRYIYGEPLLSKGLVGLLKELSIELKMVPEGKPRAGQEDCQVL